MKMFNLLKLFSKVLNHPKILPKMSYNKKIACLAIHLRKKKPLHTQLPPCKLCASLSTSFQPFSLRSSI